MRGIYTDNLPQVSAKKSRGKCLDRGASLVELALVLPLLALLVFGIFQYGMILAAYVSLRHASAIAAREATLFRPPGVPLVAWQPQITAAAVNTLGPTFIPANLGPVLVTQEDIAGPGLGDGIGVQLNYTFPLYFAFVVPRSVNGQYLLSVKTVMK